MIKNLFRRRDRNHNREFYTTYGQAMLMWTRVETNLALWFQAITEMPDWEATFAVFFSARSFQGRADMLQAALAVAWDDDPELKSFAQEAIQKAASYNSARNQIAHGDLRFSEDQRFSIGHPAKYMAEGTVSHENLVAAATNFQELAIILWEAHAGVSTGGGGKPLSKCHARLRLLPNEAYSSEPSRKQRGRERQRLSDLRKTPKL